MKKGNCPALSTPAEDRSTNLAMVSGEFLIRVVVALKSVSSGLPPAHLHNNPGARIADLTCFTLSENWLRVFSQFKIFEAAILERLDLPAHDTS